MPLCTATTLLVGYNITFKSHTLLVNLKLIVAPNKDDRFKTTTWSHHNPVAVNSNELHSSPLYDYTVSDLWANNFPMQTHLRKWTLAESLRSLRHLALRTTSSVNSIVSAERWLVQEEWWEMCMTVTRLIFWINSQFGSKRFYLECKQPWIGWNPHLGDRFMKITLFWTLGIKKRFVLGIQKMHFSKLRQLIRSTHTSKRFRWE